MIKSSDKVGFEKIRAKWPVMVEWALVASYLVFSYLMALARWHSLKVPYFLAFLVGYPFLMLIIIKYLKENK